MIERTRRENNQALLLVFAKAPRLGSGKTRLARAIGRAGALRISRSLQSKTLREAMDPRWETRLLVAERKDLNRRFPGIWPRPVVLARDAQGVGDLGERLAAAFNRAGSVAVIGADCPQLKRGILAKALRGLRRAPFVIGPAEDGGFWFFAARQGHQACAAFAGVRWSSQHACADLIGNCPGPVLITQTLQDIDRFEDWREYQRERRERRAYIALWPDASASRSGASSPYRARQIRK